MAPRVLRGIAIELDEPGTGEPVRRGQTVVVRVAGRLRRGDIFMEARECRFAIGARTVVAGLEYGVEGMRIGGRRRIRVPPHLGYRAAGIPGTVPPNAILWFDLELLGIQP